MKFHLLGMSRKLLAGIAVLVLALPVVALAAHPERPYKGSCSTVVTPLSPPGPVQQLRIDSDCTLAHLGRTTAVAYQVVTITGQSGATLTANIENTATYTAANGDQLFTEFIGTAVIDLSTGEVTYIGAETFTGGTGRFADATGSDRLQGTASIFTNRGFFTVSGKIAY